MKLSNSKKQLAKIISENGGWCEGANFSAQGQDGEVFFYETKPTRGQDEEVWSHSGVIGGDWIACGKALPNWHQTILSRDEYLHLYSAPDDDGWIEWKGGECPVDGDSVIDVKLSDGDEFFGVDADWDWHQGSGCDIVAYRLHKPEIAPAAQEHKPAPAPEAKPTIEQLAADYRNAKDYAERKQQEADAARAEAEAKLAELVAAGKAVGLALSVVAIEPEKQANPYAGVFYNAKLGVSPRYRSAYCDELCDGCGGRFGDHYGVRCASGGANA